MAHLNWQPLMPIENMDASQPHVDLEVDVARLVRDVFVIVEQVAPTTCMTQNIVIDSKVGTRNYGMPWSQVSGGVQIFNEDHEVQLVQAKWLELDHALEMDGPENNGLEEMFLFHGQRDTDDVQLGGV